MISAGGALSETFSFMLLWCIWSMIIGGIIGGVIMLKIGINKALWVFGFGQLITILGYALLAHVGRGVMYLPQSGYSQL